MRCYNATMSDKPFQFSMRRMMFAVTAVAIGFGSFAWGFRSIDDTILSWLALMMSGAALGGAIGAIFRMPITFALCGAIVVPLAVFTYFALSVSC
jgi:hypothetical protein